ncbi:thioredoxin-like protein [Phakopsora pachyrhizi]|nr:thioredoxin-like protein [Phakopsora pachyrhizi]
MPSPSTTTATLDRPDLDDSNIDLSPEDILDRIDDDFELSGMRERRLEELRAEICKNQRTRESGNGSYIEIKDSKEVLRVIESSKITVLHFFHRDFRTCRVMDRSLEARYYLTYSSTRFLKVDVANVPWLVSRLEVKVLPCTFSFINGIVKDRILGFEGVSDKSGNELDARALELRLIQTGTYHFIDPN